MTAGRRNDLLALAVILLAAGALYAHTLNVPWYFDDFGAIVNNPALRSLDTAWRQIGPKRWVAIFSFALNYHLGALDVQGYHLVNIAVHLIASCFAYLLLKRVFPGRRTLALLGALLFAVHPLQTQAVTYVVQRMASLCGLFFLLALYLFVRAREALADGAPFRSARHLGWYGAALAAGALAVFTKENAIVLPLALFLFGRFFPPQNAASPLPALYLAPFLLAPALLVAQYLLLPLAGGDEISQLTGFHQRGTPTPLRYMVTEFSVLWVYLRLLFFPYGQALDYGYPVAQTLVTARSAAALAGLLGLGAAAFALRRRRPLLTFGIIWFFLTLAVESSLIPLDPIFEHRLYLPMFGFALILIDLTQMLKTQLRQVAALAAVVLVLSGLTWQRNRLWNDPFAFYEDNLRHAPQAGIAWSNLFGRYVYAGRLEEAERLLRDSPHAFFDSNLSLARAYLERGRTDKARLYGEAALAINPAMPSGYLFLADVALREGNRQGAVDILHRGIAANPNDQELRRRAAELEPADVKSRFALALSLYNKGKLAEAMDEFVRISLVDPANAEALFNAGAIAFELGDHTSAKQILGRLRVVNPTIAAELEQKTRSAAR